MKKTATPSATTSSAMVEESFVFGDMLMGL